MDLARARAAAGVGLIACDIVARHAEALAYARAGRGSIGITRARPDRRPPARPQLCPMPATLFASADLLTVRAPPDQAPEILCGGAADHDAIARLAPALASTVDIQMATRSAGRRRQARPAS